MSRASVRETLSALERQGKLEIRRNTGTFGEVKVVGLIGSQLGFDVARDRAILERTARGVWRRRVARKPGKGLIDA